MPRSFSRVAAGAAALAALTALAACPGREKPAPPAASATVTPGAAPAAPADTMGTATASVDMPRSYMFRPETLTVHPGTRVVWTNHDVFTHGVEIKGAGGFSLTARPGRQVAHVFAQPGSYAYECPFHPQMMKGVIRVVAGR